MNNIKSVSGLNTSTSSQNDLQDTLDLNKLSVNKLARKNSTALLTSATDSNIKFASDPTTAVNLENAGNSESAFSDGLVSQEINNLQTIRLNKHSLNSENSYPLSSYGSGDENEDEEQEDYEEDLHNILHQLVSHERNRKASLDSSEGVKEFSFLNLQSFENSNNLNEADFFKRYIAIDKGDDTETFHGKLKHFFILSAAGKPIYSMNGGDEVLMGYMGLITTLISTFLDTLGEEVKLITYESTHIALMNKDPLVFVAISKISHETIYGESPESSILARQLGRLHDYLLAILSKPTILKNFHNRMNYDLRKILSPLDLVSFDKLCMKLSYGLTLANCGIGEFAYFISELLESSLQGVQITNTTRKKLSSILISSKKLKDEKEPIVQNDDGSYFKRDSASKEVYLSEDLLFSLLIKPPGLILSYMKPKNHNLSNKDINILLSMISEAVQDTSISENLWIPVCMSNFNPNGFLYVFVTQFDLSVDIEGNSQRLTLALISGNKNSFFQMRDISRYLIQKISNNQPFAKSLSSELRASESFSIIKELKVPVIKHFIYRLRKYNQYIMSELSRFGFDVDANLILQLVYFYTQLYYGKVGTSEVTHIKNMQTSSTNKNQNKKLTYARWNLKGTSMTGFMLSDNTYEFYCLSDVNINSLNLIDHCLKIIKWCEKYKKRLFFGNGTVF
ncbi:uncharacterized protein PRCAT00001928001 [Priceomyces carsonii]|uniref:uncharacterized protein n=1 Tax=Priceomyces carsonii TaxID=28549 RepID=UPI002ED86FB5|nr:unnamed protein product [Priceomyces carsonii]